MILRHEAQFADDGGFCHDGVPLVPLRQERRHDGYVDGGEGDWTVFVYLVQLNSCQLAESGTGTYCRCKSRAGRPGRWSRPRTD